MTQPTTFRLAQKCPSHFFLRYGNARASSFVVALSVVCPRGLDAKNCQIWSAGNCLCWTMRLELLTNRPERLQLVACGF